MYELGVSSGTRKLTFSANNFTTIEKEVRVTTGAVVQLNANLSPEITSSSAIRIVLSWNETPADLDAHLLTPTIGDNTYHIYWNDTGSETEPPYAALDVDETEGFGPETITIHDPQTGTYNYWVHGYSDDAPLAGSGAVVEVYGSDGLLNRFTVPRSGEQDYWHVFNVVGSTGEIQTVNQMVDLPPGGGLAAPSDLRAEAVSAFVINLFWQDNSDDEDGFEIEYKVGGDSWDSLGEVDANQTSVKIIDCQPSTTYYFRVRAFNDDGYSDYSNTASATTLDAIFTDNFDSDPLNEPPDDDSWNTYQSGSSSLYITNAKSYPSGGRCVKFVDAYSGDDNYAILGLEHEPLTEGTISLYLYISQWGSMGIVGWEDENAESYEDDATFYLQFCDDGQLIASHGLDSENDPLYYIIQDPYPTGRWCHIEIDFDMDNSTYDVKTDGNYLAQDFRFMFANSFPSMATFDIRCFSNLEMHEAYLDAVELTGEVVDPGRAISCGVPSVEPDLRLKRSPTTSGWNRSD